MTNKSSTEEINPSSIRKIGILRANALGDFIVTLPAIEALKEKFSNAEIILFGKEWHKNFCEDSEKGLRRTAVDRVIVVPLMNGIREENGKGQDEEEIKNFFTQLRKERIDIGISFQGRGITSIPFLQRAGVQKIVSLTSDNSIALPNYKSEYYYYQPEVIRYMDIVSLLGVDGKSYEPKIHVLDKDIEEAKKFLNDNALRSFIVIHPCGSDNRRMWSLEKFNELIKKLIKDGHTVIVTGSKEENAYIQNLIPTDTRCVNAAGKISLGGLAGLFKLSALLISVDTGPLHLAIASGAKTIGMYWAPNIINWAPLSRVKHRPVINWELKCPRCGIIPNDPYPYEPQTNACDHNVSFIEPIAVSEVLTQVKFLLQ